MKWWLAAPLLLVACRDFSATDVQAAMSGCALACTKTGVSSVDVTSTRVQCDCNASKFGLKDVHIQQGGGDGSVGLSVVFPGQDPEIEGVPAEGGE